MKQSAAKIEKWIEEIVAYLPHQAPLQDFIHHNPLSYFHELGFHEANSHFARVYGARTYLALQDYRSAYGRGEISEKSLRWAWVKNQQKTSFEDLLNFNPSPEKRLFGQARYALQNKLRIDFDHWVYPKLFRTLSHATDQGVCMVWLFDSSLSFLDNLRQLNEQTKGSLFYQGLDGLGSKLLREGESLELLLNRLADMPLQKAYLFDQVLSHPGWSGMISQFEHRHESQLRRPLRISLIELATFECLLELDLLERFHPGWKPLTPEDLSTESRSLLMSPAYPLYLLDGKTEFLLKVWQEAKERETHLQALHSISAGVRMAQQRSAPPDFQAIFCIDDREESLRRHLEGVSSSVQTFSTAGYFGVEFLYQSDAHRYPTKLCPAPLSPQYLVKGVGDRSFAKSDHLSSLAENPLTGPFWVPALGLTMGFKLMFNLFRPRFDLARTTAFQQADSEVQLHYERDGEADGRIGLQGFTLDEMADRVAGTLLSMGLKGNFAPLIYVIGHGASSTNNPYYAAYDCGACSGRPGAINARVFCEMANRPEVRALLLKKGIEIPQDTLFVAGLHDTTTDQIRYYVQSKEDNQNFKKHDQFIEIMQRALHFNAMERARKLPGPETTTDSEQALGQVIERSENLFETRPELNHANNCLCVVGPRDFTERVFFDRRAFLNSYDASQDPNGRILEGILSAVFPVCGGINLEYYYSRVDNQRLGSASKLPHNIVGLIGVANGVEGDLRTGLPLQMIEFHEPLRLMVVIVAAKEQVEEVLSRRPDLQSWVDKGWVLMSICEPKTGALYSRQDGQLVEIDREDPATLRLPRRMSIVGHRDLPLAVIEEVYDK